MAKNTLENLQKTITERKKNGDAASSYVAKLFKKGKKKMAQKVVEEAGEVAVAALAEGPDELKSEAADLLFHLMVLLSDSNISVSEVLDELQSREGISGISEKQNRNND
ncbi:MAG: phosphoribosyl-ATP diphosphatase [Rickettsiales bacterium]|nr:phosphoribosyl-ATP diphosphatase [Rickettsiales bacterium]